MDRCICYVTFRTKMGINSINVHFLTIIIVAYAATTAPLG